MSKIRKPTVIHVTESFASGTASAITDFVRNSPDVTHHLVYSLRPEALVDPREMDCFASAVEMPAGTWARIRFLRRHLRSGEDAVIHAHSSKAGAYVRAAVRRTRRRPIVYTPHCYAFERRDTGRVLRGAFRTAEWLLSFNTTAYGGCSPREAELSRWPLRRPGVVAIPNVQPVPPGSYEPRIEHGLHIVGNGRLGPQKDPEFFAAAVAAARAEFPDIEATWIGDGDPAIADALRGQAITVTGWLSRQKALEVMASGDLYLHSAMWEGFPIAILEAAGLGLPVVARNRPYLSGVALPEVIDEPAELASVVAGLRRPAALDALRRDTAAALAGNTDHAQQNALRSLYGPLARRPIHVNGKWLVQRQTGTQRYAAEIVRAIGETSDVPLVAHVPAGADVPGWLSERAEIRRGPAKAVVFEQIYLPVATAGQLLLNFAGPAPLLKRRQLVTMHDATPFRFPQTFRKTFVGFYAVMYGALGRYARHLVTVSHFSAGELGGVLRIPDARFTVAGCAADRLTQVAPARPDVPGIDGRFYLVVGTLATHKNLPAPVQAIVDSGRTVVVVGAAGNQQVFSGPSALAQGAVVAGHLSDAELAWLYRNAEALVFPSKYEGFGMPPLEAQALGCPVVASTAAALPEVLADTALFFDPDDTTALLDRLGELEGNPALAARLRAWGAENSRRYTWAGSAAAVLRALGVAPAGADYPVPHGF
ncbi:MAG: glycosyltransferase [Mycobacterium sp.]